MGNIGNCDEFDDCEICQQKGLSPSGGKEEEFPDYYYEAILDDPLHFGWVRS